MAEKVGIRPASIIIKENKVLVVRSRYEDREFYLFPGGGIEFGETIRDALIREALEETGMKIKVVKPVYINEYIDKDDKSKRVVNIFFISEIEDENIRKISNDKGKIKGIKWVKLENLEKIDLKPEFIKNRLKKDAEKNFSDSIVYNVDYK